MTATDELMPIPRLDRCINRDEVLRVTGWSRVTLWRQVRRQKFPKPVRTTEKRIAWLESEVAGWLKAKTAERNMIR